MKRQFASIISVIIVLLLTSCKLSITSFDAPDSADTGTAINLLVTAIADATGDNASDHGVIVQVPESWQVLYGKVQVPGYGEFELGQRPDYAALYTPQAGYKIWVGTAGQGQGQSTTLTFKVRVMTGDFPGNPGDTSLFSLKAVVGVFRDNAWATDDPQGVFQFGNITQDPYGETITIVKEDDQSTPAPVTSLAVTDNYDGSVSLSWNGYDEEGQRDVVNYRVYVSSTEFSSVSGMTPEATVNTGTFYYYRLGLSYGSTYYFAVTAVDELLHENVNVTPVAVTPREGGGISGTVTRESDGLPVPNVTVIAYDFTTGNGIRSAQSQSDGSYLIAALPEGTYRVEVDATSNGFIRECYAETLGQCFPVQVTLGATTSGINFSLTAGGSITGVVTGASDGQPISGMQVNAWDPATGNQVGYAWTQPDGSYVIGGLPSGNYRVDAGIMGGTDFIGEYYNGKYDLSLADLVSVMAGQTTAGVNFSLAQGGSISGIVTREADGLPISGVYVNAYDIATGSQINGGMTQPDGSYVIKGLPSGTYRVEAATWGTNYIREYYNNTYDWNLAAPVPVTTGQTTAGINFSLAQGGSISGVVTRESNGQPMSGVQVNAYEILTGAQINYGMTQADGSYVIGGLSSGNYRVEAVAWASDYVREYYNNTTNMNSAAPVAVTVGQATVGINFSLALGGSISGVVTREVDGLPISGTQVNACDFITGQQIGWGFTQFDGSYVIRGLPAGSYRLDSGSGTDYVREYYNNTTNLNSAEAVPVTVGHTSSGINFRLAQGGSISGVVTRESDSLGIPGVQVNAFDPITHQQISWSMTQSDGSYVIRGLPSGSFRVDAVAWRTDYVSEYYNNTTDWDSAERVPVAVGQTTPGINFSLKTGGSISGRVIRASGQPAANINVYARDFFTGIQGNTGYTLEDGSYMVSGLIEGTYAVGISNSQSGYFAECVGQVGNQCSPVQVVTGQTTSGIDFILSIDTDLDGYIENFDLFTTNSGEWSDADGDGIGDNADPDDDDDGIADSEDNCPYIANPDQADSVENGIGNACRADRMEGFEAGDFSRFPWASSGDGLWSVTTARPHTGSYSAGSPLMLDNQRSSLEVSLACGSGVITFWFSVDSEANFDYLRFYIDEELAGAWSGSIAYSQATFKVDAGLHRFKWAYTKDYSVSNGLDAAWVDDIRFPGVAGHTGALKGDINGDGIIDLIDTVMGLQIMSGMNPQGVRTGADVEGDGGVGLQEAIYTLQKVSGLRWTPPAGGGGGGGVLSE